MGDDSGEVVDFDNDLQLHNRIYSDPSLIPSQIQQRQGESQSWIQRKWLRLKLALRQSSHHFMNSPTPFLHQKTKKAEVFQVSAKEEPHKINWHIPSLHSLIFPNIPEHYTLDKKLSILKSTYLVGRAWDGFLILLSLFACAMYVSETYDSTFEAVKLYFTVEVIITNFFAIDFVYMFFAAFNKLQFLFNPWTIVDLITIIPVYISIAFQGRKKSPNLSVFRFVRILRLVRILRTFKMLGGLSGIKRQVITLSLTLVSLVFMAAGIMQIMENDFRQQTEFHCKYINEYTLWEPSCSPSKPFNPNTCDCHEYNCHAFYNRFDIKHQPTGVKCSMLSFFDAFYFLVVTVATVGYGDISPSTAASRAVVIIFIVTSLVVIPMQVNQLTTLLSMNSQYRNAYSPAASGADNHVILCGHISDWRKLDNFFKEFFHPDRTAAEVQEYHLVILSPMEPSENLKALLLSPMFDGKISYIIGSALSMEDLVKAGANYAAAMFFICNTEVGEALAKLDDAATVLRTLSVHNFNPKLECFVQVLKSEDREILKDSNIDVILCLDEYKTALQARNAICPGLSTLIENLFHTFGGDNNNGPEAEKSQWLEEYMEGADKEVYYIPLNFKFLDILTNEWSLIVEGLFLEFDVMLIGLVNPVEHHIIINPTKLEMQGYKSSTKFFANYKVGILLADEQAMATAVEQGMADPFTVDRIINKILLAEQNFHVRRPKDTKKSHSVRLASKEKEKVRKGSRRKEIKSQEEKNLKEKEKNDYHRQQIRSLNEIIRVTKERSTDIQVPVKEGDGNSKVEDDEDQAFSGRMVDRESISVNKNNKGGKGVRKNIMDLFGISSTKKKAKDKRDLDEIAEDDEDNENSDESDGGSPLRGSEYSAPGTPGTPFTGAEGSSPLKVDTGSPVLTPSAIIPKDKASSGKRHRASFMAKVTNFEQKSNHTGGIATGSRRRSSAGDDESFAAKLALLLQQGQQGSDLGQVSKQLDDCNGLKDHIIVFGSVVNLLVFISELRRPLIVGSSYHPIVVVDDVEPPNWNLFIEKYSDIYFLKGKMTNSFDFNRSNVREAFAVVILASRDSVTKVEEENLDADTLFSFLKLEKYIPRNVFFTVELTCASNMSVLNSTTVRRAQATLEAEAKAKAKVSNEDAAKDIFNSLSSGSNSYSRLSNGSVDSSMPQSDGNSTIKRKIAGAHDRQERGTFTTQRKYTNNASTMKLHDKKAEKIPLVGKGKEKDDNEEEGNNEEAFHKTREEAFWTVAETHHMLPVFASGRAFVPSTFDSLLCQSFFTIFTPVLCEKLVCGQKYQTMYQIPCPKAFAGRYFADLFRAFNSKHICVMAIYRAPCLEDKSVIPFIITCPKPDIMMRENDKLYVYCNPLELNDALESSLNLDLIHISDQIYSLDEKLLDKHKEAARLKELEKSKNTVSATKPKVIAPLKSLLQRKVNAITNVHRMSKAFSHAKIVPIAPTVKPTGTSAVENSSGSDNGIPSVINTDSTSNFAVNTDSGSEAASPSISAPATVTMNLKGSNSGDDTSQ